MSNFETLWKELEAHVHDGPGELAPEKRKLSHVPHNAPNWAQKLVKKLHVSPAEIDDQDIYALKDQGWDDDQIFEFILSGSIAAARTRHHAAIKLLRGTKGDKNAA